MDYLQIYWFLYKLLFFDLIRMSRIGENGMKSFWIELDFWDFLRGFGNDDFVKGEWIFFGFMVVVMGYAFVRWVVNW